MAKRVEVPGLPEETVLCIACAITIDCPAAHAFDVLLDTSTWPTWNSFCPAVNTKSTILKTGAPLTLQVRMTSDSSLREQKEVVSELSRPTPGSGAPYRVCWDAAGTMSTPRFMLRTKRENEFHEIRNGEATVQCEYKTWGAMAGPLAHVVKRMFAGTLQERFEDWARDLKAYAEKTWQEKNLEQSNGGSRRDEA